MKTDREWLIDVNIAYNQGKIKGREDAIKDYVNLFTENALNDDSKTWTEYARKVAKWLEEKC